MSALMLRVIACVAMLIDHIGYQYGIMLFRAIGRIAFPIFMYLICNGYKYTSNKTRYAIRLGLFALISQIPFSLFCYNSLAYPNGNVMFTLFFALICVWSADVMRGRPVLRWFSLLPTVFIILLYHFDVLCSDYGARGILLALVFYFFDGKSIRCRIFTTLGMTFTLCYGFLLSCAKQLVLLLLGRGAVLPQMGTWDLYQFFALAALLFIFAYNGQKGTYPKSMLAGKALQYGFYAFYPVHQVLLFLIRIF